MFNWIVEEKEVPILVEELSVVLMGIVVEVSNVEPNIKTKKLYLLKDIE